MSTPLIFFIPISFLFRTLQHDLRFLQLQRLCELSWKTASLPKASEHRAVLVCKHTALFWELHACPLFLFALVARLRQMIHRRAGQGCKRAQKR